MSFRNRPTISMLVSLAAAACVASAAAEDRMVLSESFTSTNCVYCPYAGYAQDYIQNLYEDEVLVLQWHVSDGFTTSVGNSRANNLYFVPGTPTTWFNGTDQHVGANTNQSAMNAQYNTAAQNQFGLQPEASIEIDVVELPSQNGYDVTATITFPDDGQIRPAAIYLLRVRDHFPSAPYYRNCVRDATTPIAVPGAPGATYTLSDEFVMGTTDLNDLENCRFVAFAQYYSPMNPPSWSNPGGEIYQSAVVSYPFSPPPVAGDIDGDGVVGSVDLNLLLTAWDCDAGDCGGADLTGDGVVGAEDLNILLGNWNE